MLGVVCVSFYGGVGFVCACVSEKRFNYKAHSRYYQTRRKPREGGGPYTTFFSLHRLSSVGQRRVSRHTTMSDAKPDDLTTVKETLSERAKERAKDRQRITELETLVEELQDRVSELEERAPTLEDKQYQAMDKADKATLVRDKLYKQALTTGGKAAIGYKDVIRMFDGNPSPGHAYDIMEKAGTRPGFKYTEGPEGEKRLQVVASKTDRENE